MKKFAQIISFVQIGALLKKDFLVRLRQPWMLVVQLVWPCMIFMALYTVRHRFTPYEIDDCQFPTRLLPTKGHVLPFFHSYICTLDNLCSNPDDYEEISTFENAPLKPVLNILQTFINEDALYNAVVNLPEKANFVTAITSVVSHPSFKSLEENVGKVIERVPAVEKMVAGHFKLNNLFADGETFSNLGRIICGKPFPRRTSIRIVRKILSSEDFSQVNDEELQSMPTKYCKQLYLDVSGSNGGKITWKHIKPIILGKILYGPKGHTNDDIIKYANLTFEEMGRFRNLSRAVDITLTKLRTDAEFNSSFMGLLDLIKSPLIQAIIGGSINVDTVESVMNRIATDKTIADIFRTVADLLECFSIDRFIPVKSAKDLEEKAYDLNHKKLFYAGIYFDQSAGKDIDYTLRMEYDNTPITSETNNRFWFPGPDANFELDHRYHRGFIQIKHALDIAIIKHKVKLKESEDATSTTTTTTTAAPPGNGTVPDHKDTNVSVVLGSLDDIATTTTMETPTTKKDPNSTDSLLNKFLTTLGTDTQLLNGTFDDDDENLEDFLNFTDTDDKKIESNNLTESDSRSERRRRSPQGGLLGLFLGGGSSKEEPTESFEIDNVVMHTKQFPYPKYTKDTFKKGIYLAQSIQMAFFIALLVQVATCVRFRIWMKESKNTMIMRSMGLQATSEVITWIITTFIEIVVVFLIACVILYGGGLIKYTGFIFLFLFLLMFGLCVISFCYMCSTFFSSASIGSVSSAILFLMTFLPYIVIISLDETLSDSLKFITNLSLSTAFCYAWNHVMRLELQDRGMSFMEAFNAEDDEDNDFKYAFFMLILDFIIYVVIGFFVERMKNDEFKFHKVRRDEMDANVGAVLQNISKVYDTKVAVSNVSLVIPKYHITCLLGRNGSGKSTLIKMLTGQIKPTTGKLALSKILHDDGGLDTIGFCSQDNVLIPNLTAREHLELYARIKLKTEFEFEVQKTMKNLKFGKYENFQVSQLSGGYKRRLCVAIAFIGSPNLVILDEPCAGVDTKARKCVWELIEVLRKGRAVVLATHYLDEAEYLGDSITILNEGKVFSQHSPQSLKNLFTKTFDVTITTQDSNGNKIVDDIKNNLRRFVENYDILESSEKSLKLSIPYESADEKANRCPELIGYLEKLQKKQEIGNFSVTSRSLEEIFNNLYHGKEHLNGNVENHYEKIDLSKNDHTTKENLSRPEVIRSLFWKRFSHFRRNFRLLICILILPAIFEVIAMAFLQLRPGGEHDTNLELTRDLYFATKQFMSLENKTNFTGAVMEELRRDCFECMEFENSKSAFRWVLDTHKEYHMNRYGGYTFNQSNATVWYNNKGYHAMAAYVNDLNSHMLRVEMNDHEYTLRTFNYPINMEETELSESSILQQVADAGVSLILLIAFSLITAGGSVFIVNERVNGEKLQQKLCGVDFQTYWGVAFFWDLFIYSIALLICVIVFVSFNIPVYVDKSNLDGICLLLFMFGYASIPAVHLFEKLFTEASVAYMATFCMNVIIGLTTLTVILLFDILGESNASEKWRDFFDQIFLIFPQHALSDGLIQICKNYIVAHLFSRYDIDAYQSPITSSMLRRNYISMFIMGTIFMAVNFAIESGFVRRVAKKYCRKKSPKTELKIVSIQNSLKRDDKFSPYGDNWAIKVENVYKAYRATDYAVRDVSFEVKNGECFGLLGNNGAGKSTMFGILSGQLQPTTGSVTFLDNNISYCPQTSALDSLLTVKEVIRFYGTLRRITDIPRLISSTLKAFHLDDYKDVLVKNLSGGNRRKLNVAVSCFGDTSVVLMDEPTSDMDPVTRSLVYQAINELIAQRRSVLMTSHAISEIDRVCHRIAVLKDGTLLTTGSPEQLESRCGGYYTVTIFEDKIDAAVMERDIKREFSQNVDLQVHTHSVKFLIKIKLKQNDDENNEITEDDGCLSLSELFTKLNKFCTERSINFTITKCLLDKIFENILDSAEYNLDLDECSGGYVHKGFIQEETVT